jgi:hypothetical protein
MKGGANPTEIRSIAKYFAAGHNAEAIANSMALRVETVKSFHPDNVAKVKKAKAAAAKRNDAEHKAKKDIMKAAKSAVRDMSTED